MIDRVIDFFEKNKLQLNNKKIVIAVSAGVDSMVLLEIFIELKARFDFAIEVAHINHQVRKQSKDEEKYIKTFCCVIILSVISIAWKRTTTLIFRIMRVAKDTPFSTAS